MTRRRISLFVSLALCACAVLGALSPPGIAAPRAGWLYVESNVGTPNGNAVLALDYGSNGSTRPLRIREYPTRGTGEIFTTSGNSLGALAADQEVTISGDHKFLFAVNKGSNTIAVFRIDQATGALKHVPGSPFPSFGDDPISVGWAGKYLVVVNHGQAIGDPIFGAGTANYVSYSISPKGRLKRVSTVDAPKFGPETAAVSPDQKHVFGADFWELKWESLNLSSKGQLAPAAGSPGQFPPSVSEGRSAPPTLPATAVNVPFGVAVHPKQKLVYILATVAGRLVTYRYADDGQMTFVSQTDNDQAVAACWLAITSDGRYMYSANTVTSNISSFDLTDPEHPKQFQSTAVTTGAVPLNVAIDSTDSFLFLDAAHDDPDFPRTQLPDGNFVVGFRIGNGGRLTEISSAPLPVPFRTTLPLGMATLSKGG